MAKIIIKTAKFELEIETDSMSEGSACAYELIERIGKQNVPDMAVIPNALEASKPPAIFSGTVTHEKSADEKFKRAIDSYSAVFKPKSCRDFLNMAAFHITLNDDKLYFSRKELLERAREANGWKTEFSNQQSQSIQRMKLSGELIEKQADLFSLPTKIIDEKKAQFNE